MRLSTPGTGAWSKDVPGSVRLSETGDRARRKTCRAARRRADARGEPASRPAPRALGSCRGPGSSARADGLPRHGLPQVPRIWTGMQRAGRAGVIHRRGTWPGPSARVRRHGSVGTGPRRGAGGAVAGGAVAGGAVAGGAVAGGAVAGGAVAGGAVASRSVTSRAAGRWRPPRRRPLGDQLGRAARRLGGQAAGRWLAGGGGGAGSAAWRAVAVNSMVGRAAVRQRAARRAERLDRRLRSASSGWCRGWSPVVGVGRVGVPRRPGRGERGRRRTSEEDRADVAAGSSEQDRSVVGLEGGGSSGAAVLASG